MEKHKEKKMRVVCASTVCKTEFFLHSIAARDNTHRAVDTRMQRHFPWVVMARSEISALVTQVLKGTDEEKVKAARVSEGGGAFRQAKHQQAGTCVQEQYTPCAP